jgi:RimJ/RimL family protein N-acetyltransferase
MLAGERLVLRPVREADRDWLVELQMSRAVRRYLGGARDRAAAETAAAAMLSTGWGVFVAEQHDGERAGVLSFDDHRGELEVSYAFDPDRWNRGFAFEALQTILSWLAEVGTPSVIAVTQAANARSLRLLDRLGFVEETRFTEFGELQVQLRRDLTAGPAAVS